MQEITQAEWATLPAGVQELYAKSLYRVVLDSYTVGMYGVPGIAWVIFYIFAQIMVVLHLWHGFSSAVLTMGVNHTRYNKLIKMTGYGFTVVVIGGFVAIPIIMYLCNSVCS
jgi:succinate dehydrogenase / fumarate reductase cytochrome b subunit